MDKYVNIVCKEMYPPSVPSEDKNLKGPVLKNLTTPRFDMNKDDKKEAQNR